MKRCAQFFVMLWAASPVFASDARYFFASALTETDDPAVTGAYATPECAVLSPADYQAVRANCAPWDKLSEQCDTKKTVHVKVDEKEQYDFQLVYYVFNNLAACHKARTEMTSSPELE